MQSEPPGGLCDYPENHRGHLHPVLERWRRATRRVFHAAARPRWDAANLDHAAGLPVSKSRATTASPGASVVPTVHPQTA
jgi:hypothetical protein